MPCPKVVESHTQTDEGAGVIGLTTALILAPHGRWKITVVAKHMPGDYDIEYASPWAGANYLPYVQNFVPSFLDRMSHPNSVHRNHLNVMPLPTLTALGNQGRSWPNLSVRHGQSCKGSHRQFPRRVYTFKVKLCYGLKWFRYSHFCRQRYLQSPQGRRKCYRRLVLRTDESGSLVQGCRTKRIASASLSLLCSVLTHSVPEAAKERIAKRC